MKVFILDGEILIIGKYFIYGARIDIHISKKLLKQFNIQNTKIDNLDNIFIKN